MPYRGPASERERQHCPWWPAGQARSWKALPQKGSFSSNFKCRFSKCRGVAWRSSKVSRRNTCSANEMLPSRVLHPTSTPCDSTCFFQKLPQYWRRLEQYFYHIATFRVALKDSRSIPRQRKPVPQSRGVAPSYSGMDPGSG